MKTHYTVDDMVAAGPCPRFPQERVEYLWAGRPGLTAREIAGLDILAPDRMRALAYLAGPRAARLSAVHSARRALALVPNHDPRLVMVVRVAERYALGRATDHELAVAYAAARVVTWAAAAMSVTQDAAEAVKAAAALSAVWAAWAAATSAAWAARAAYAAESWQESLDQIVELMEQDDDD